MGDARLVLTVRGESEKFEAWLKQHPLVETMTPRIVGGGYASATVDLDGDTREQLLSDLIAAGFGLRLVEVPDTELEEIFLGLTRDKVT